MKQVHIVSGDIDGIGLEVSLKALLKIGPQKNLKFFLWRSQEDSPLFLKKEFDFLYDQFICSRQREFSQDSVEKQAQLVEIISSKPPASWVKQVAEICLKDKKSNALVTAPLSKIQMNKDGFPFKGHTDLLKTITNCENLFMCFLGEKFNVVLVTDHLPLSKISLNKKILKEALNQSLDFRKYLQVHNRPIGVLGLNPHAGEQGILGSEEVSMIQPLIEEYSKNDVVGPLIPDRAFSSSNWSLYSFYLCLYHDQGLIPFKMIHSKNGVHLTLGLPFIRTSVDHGTAKDIFGQNKASETSMVQAIKWALKLLSQK